MASSGNKSQVTKGNFKSYEGQARLVRAMVAAHPNVKWNFAEIEAHYGSDVSFHGLNHRFRVIKAQAKIVASARKAGVDCKRIPVSFPGKTEKDIARFYGASTADGISWQFRSIKKDADALKAAANNGGDPSSTTISTPRGKPSAAAATPSSRTPASNKRTAAASGGSTVNNKRQKKGKSTSNNFADLVKAEDEDEDDNIDDEGDIDWSELEETPSKRTKFSNNIKPASATSAFGTPARAATSAAKGAISQQSISLIDSDDDKDDFESGGDVSRNVAPAAAQTRAKPNGVAVAAPAPALAAPAAAVTASSANTAGNGLGNGNGIGSQAFVDDEQGWVSSTESVPVAPIDNAPMFQAPVSNAPQHESSGYIQSDFGDDGGHQDFVSAAVEVYEDGGSAMDAESDDGEI